MLTLTYLGVAGWQLQAGRSSLLVDPYFTRLPLWRLAFGRAAPDADVVAQHTPPGDWLLVTHPHYDHLLDVPEAARLTGATVYASEQGCALLGLLSVPGEQVCPIAAGDRLALGPFDVEVYRVPHRLTLGRVPAEGPLREGLKPPLRVRDYRTRELFSFHIGVSGLRVLIASGIDDEPEVEADVLLVGADASRAQLRRILGAAQPRLVLPNHWDDMFRPLSEPVRPSFRPPRRLGLPRRLDLDAWAAAVRELAPGAQVLVPEWFAPVGVDALLG